MKMPRRYFKFIAKVNKTWLQNKNYSKPKYSESFNITVIVIKTLNLYKTLFRRLNYAALPNKFSRI